MDIGKWMYPRTNSCSCPNNANSRQDGEWYKKPASSWFLHSVNSKTTIISENPSDHRLTEDTCRGFRGGSSPSGAASTIVVTVFCFEGQAIPQGTGSQGPGWQVLGQNLLQLMPELSQERGFPHTKPQLLPGKLKKLLCFPHQQPFFCPWGESSSRGIGSSSPMFAMMMEDNRKIWLCCVPRGSTPLRLYGKSVEGNTAPRWDEGCERTKRKLWEKQAI